MDLEGWTTHHLGFVDIQLDDNIAIVRIYEGADVQEDEIMLVVNRIESFMSGDYGIVFDEVYPHSIQFDALQQLKHNPRIKRIAIVTYRQLTIGTMDMAMYVVDKPHKMFESLDMALQWIQQEMKQDD